MSLIKSLEDIEKMRVCGQHLSDVLACVIRLVKPGLAIKYLDECAQEEMKKRDCTPSFLGYKTQPRDPAFPSAVCVSVNDEVVHGLGDRVRMLQEGDIVGLDIGCWYQGICTDMAVTVPVGKAEQKYLDLIQATKESLLAGVAAARVGNTVYDISTAIENSIRPHGYGIVRALVGHGVGHKVHESPAVPNFTEEASKYVLLQKGMCLALEPMITLGDCAVKTASDGWTVVTRDHSWAAHFEVTIAFTSTGTEILTPLPV